MHVLTNLKIYYKVASSWLLLLSHITLHGSMNIKFKKINQSPNSSLENRTLKWGQCELSKDGQQAPSEGQKDVTGIVPLLGYSVSFLILSNS